MKNSKKFGFTLVEIVVTLMIIITLSLISFPIYRGRSRQASKLAEGYALLGTIIEAQVGYYNEYGNFAIQDVAFPENLYYGDNAFTSYDPYFTINAINNRYFTSFNCYGLPGSSNRRDQYRYSFKAIVRSKDAGTISLLYNVTQRFEPKVEGI